MRIHLADGGDEIARGLPSKGAVCAALLLTALFTCPQPAGAGLHLGLEFIETTAGRLRATARPLAPGLQGRVLRSFGLGDNSPTAPRASSESVAGSGIRSTAPTSSMYQSLASYKLRRNHFPPEYSTS